MDKEKLQNFMDQIKQVYSLRDNREVKIDSDLRADLNTTSLQYFALISIVEDMSGKTVSYSQIKACKTIEDVRTLVDD